MPSTSSEDSKHMHDSHPHQKRRAPGSTQHASAAEELDAHNNSTIADAYSRRSMEIKIAKLSQGLEAAQAQIDQLKKDLLKERQIRQRIQKENDALRQALGQNKQAAGGAPNSSRSHEKEGLSSPRVKRHKRGRLDEKDEDKPSKHDLKWLERFQELQKFRQIYGHCNVPSNIQNQDPQWGKLASWVSTQRTQHKLLRTGQWTTLKPERVRQLTDVGFQWTAFQNNDPAGSAGKAPTLTFAERVKQLAQYKLRHGDCNVPQKYEETPGLGNFVLEQRKLYRRGKLHQSKVDQLAQLGFQWSLRNRGGTLEDRMKRAQEEKEAAGGEKIEKTEVG